MAWMQRGSRWTLVIGLLALLWPVLSGDIQSASASGKARVIALTLAFLVLFLLPDSRARSALAWLVLGASIGFVVLGFFGLGVVVLLPLVSILLFMWQQRSLPAPSEMWAFLATTLLGMVAMMPLF